MADGSNEAMSTSGLLLVRDGAAAARMTPFKATTPASSATRPSTTRRAVPHRAEVARRCRCRGGPGQAVRIDDDLVVMLATLVSRGVATVLRA